MPLPRDGDCEAQHQSQSFKTCVHLWPPPRSGTVWLQREVCLELGATFLPECSLLTQQIELYGRTLRYSDHQRFRSTFRDADSLMRYYKDNVIRLAATIVRSNGLSSGSTLVLKDPSLALCLDDLRTLFPESKTLLLIRDPRDVMASMKMVSTRRGAVWDIAKTIPEIFTYYHGIVRFLDAADGNCLIAR